MINITVWTEGFMKALQSTFGERVWFVGLQGSYGRGEATETSDIDLVVILDKLQTEDIKEYNNMLDGLSNRELICGFLSGKDELMNWAVSDLFQFYYDTLPLKGSLDELVCKIDKSAVENAIKLGACNIYHGCVHNMLYEKSNDVLAGLYKSASFVVQAIYYQQTGKYLKRQDDLLTDISNNNKEIIQIFQSIKNGTKINFDKMSEILFRWSQGVIQS